MHYSYIYHNMFKHDIPPPRVPTERRARRANRPPEGNDNACL